MCSNFFEHATNDFAPQLDGVALKNLSHHPLDNGLHPTAVRHSCSGVRIMRAERCCCLLTSDYKPLAEITLDTRVRVLPVSPSHGTSCGNTNFSHETNACPQNGPSRYNSILRFGHAAAKNCIELRMSAIQPNVSEQPLSEELQLVRAAKGGDDKAFEELV